MQVMGARRAWAQILATARTEDTTIKRVLVTHRYEARALAQRKFATRQFDDEFPAYDGVPLISPAQAVALRATHPSSGPDLTRDSYRYKGFRQTNPRYPTIYRAYHRPLETVLAERDRRAAALRLRQTNPTGEPIEPISILPNEPDAMRVAETTTGHGQTIQGFAPIWKGRSADTPAVFSLLLTAAGPAIGRAARQGARAPALPFRAAAGKRQFRRDYCTASAVARVSRVQLARSWRMKVTKCSGLLPASSKRCAARFELLGRQLHRAGRGLSPRVPSAAV